MSYASLTPKAIDATRRALLYWHQNWDWECPTLFGLEQEELHAVFLAWPEFGENSRETVAAAVVGAYRELLYGASAVPQSQVNEVLGVTYIEARSLFERLYPLLRNDSSLKQ